MTTPTPKGTVWCPRCLDWVPSDHDMSAVAHQRRNVIVEHPIPGDIGERTT